MQRRRARVTSRLTLAIVAVLVGVSVHTSLGFEKWRSPSGGWWADCHGDFDSDLRRAVRSSPSTATTSCIARAAQ